MRSIVIGSLFGDEGKGRTVASIPSDLVVRYSGGHQAGHTVWINEEDHHVFSSFGSGTFNKTPTYWSKNCPFSIRSFLVERVMLQKMIDKHYDFSLDFIPYFLHKDSPIVTMFDMIDCQKDTQNMKHGSCGSGINKTLRREEALYSLKAEDIMFPSVFIEKYTSIAQNYYHQEVTSDDIVNIKNQIIAMRKCVVLVGDEFFDIQKYDHILYEGSQGLLLDYEIGFFPHVTPSLTGMKGVMSLKDNGISNESTTFYYNTRAYMTRHGNGPFDKHYVSFNNTHLNHETNKHNKFQGKFKYSLLNLDWLRYALYKDSSSIDKSSLSDNKYFNKILVVNCIDHLEEFALIYNNEKVVFDNVNEFKRYLELKLGMRCILNGSPIPDSEPFE